MPARKVDEVKDALSVCFIIAPLFVFWSLYDQHSSRWIFQAELMDRTIGSYTMSADQTAPLSK